MFCKLFVKDNLKINLGIDSMALSDPRADFIDIITLGPVKNLIGINQMVLSSPWDNSIDIIVLKIVKKNTRN